MVGDLGVLIGLVLLIVLAMRGVNMLVASLLAAAVVAVTNGQSLYQALYVDYATTMMNMAGSYLLLFLAGAVFGRVIEEGHAATTIAHALTRWLGVNRLLWVTSVTTALLTYGGVSVFVIVFTMYPLCLAMMRRANLPKRLFLGAILLGPGTFVSTALPGSPSVHNNISATELGTSLSAGWGLGLTATAVMAGLGMLWLELARGRAIARGEGFVPMPEERDAGTHVKPEAMPSTPRAFAPLLVVVGVILLPQFIGGLMDDALLAGNPAGRLVLFARAQALPWTCVAMFAGALSGLVLFRGLITSPLATLSRGAERCPLPLFNWASVIGFGGVVQSTDVFGQFAEFAVNAPVPPIVSMVCATNIFAAIVGSASGGLALFYKTLWPLYEDPQLPLHVVHRLATIASGGLDSLPHSGALITTLTVMHMNHRQGYGTAFVITVVIPLIALAAVTTLAMVIY